MDDLRNLFPGKQAKFTFCEGFIQNERSHLQPFEVQHGLSAKGKHPLDLVEFPFVQRHKRLAFFACTEDLKSRLPTDKPVVKRHAGGKSVAVLLRQRAGDPGIVDLVHMLFRREQIVGKLTVVGQQEQPLRVLIEPPDRKEPHFPVLRGQKVQHRFTAPVLGCRQNACRLMQHDVGITPVAERLTGNKDLRRFRVVFLLRTARCFSVNKDLSVSRRE